VFATLANQKKQKTKRRDDSKLSTQGWQMPQGFLPQLDEFYFTTAEKKLLENCRCIVPNFTND
jgi:hypothetical protein